MGLQADKVQVYAASLTDEIGSLRDILTGLSDAGANLGFVIARRSPDKPGSGVVFVTPLEGDDLIAAAEGLGFSPTESVHSVRIEGDDAPGAGAEICGKIADAGVSMRGFSAAVIGNKYIAYIGLDSSDDADKVIAALQ